MVDRERQHRAILNGESLLESRGPSARRRLCGTLAGSFGSSPRLSPQDNVFRSPADLQSDVRLRAELRLRAFVSLWLVEERFLGFE